MGVEVRGAWVAVAVGAALGGGAGVEACGVVGEGDGEGAGAGAWCCGPGGAFWHQVAAVFASLAASVPSCELSCQLCGMATLGRPQHLHTPLKQNDRNWHPQT